MDVEIDFDLKKIFISCCNFIAKNWLIFLSIVIILGITWYDVATVQSQKMEVLNKCIVECNEWARDACPMMKPAENFENIMINAEEIVD